MTTAPCSDAEMIEYLSARVAELEASNAHYIQVAHDRTNEAAEAEDARKRADRDADWAGERADAWEAIATRLFAENKLLRVQKKTAPCRALVPMCDYARADLWMLTQMKIGKMNQAKREFSKQQIREYAPTGARCRALVPTSLFAPLWCEIDAIQDAHTAADDRATLARCAALEFPPCPF